MPEGAGTRIEVSFLKGGVIVELVVVLVVVVMYRESPMVGRLVGHPELFTLEGPVEVFYLAVVVEHVSLRVEDGQLQLLYGEVDGAFPKLDVYHPSVVMVEELIIEYGQLCIEEVFTVALLTIELEDEKRDFAEREYCHHHKEQFGAVTELDGTHVILNIKD